MSHKSLALMLSGSLLLGLGSLAPAHSAPIVFEKKFANCEALNKTYPGGVAKNKKATNRGGESSYIPVVSLKIYKANVSKDRDKDGIACER